MWVSVKERMPEYGVEVYVKSDYTPAQLKSFPKARRNRPMMAKHWGDWDSNEWRGTVAITHWWEDEAASQKDNNSEVAHEQQVSP